MMPEETVIQGWKMTEDEKILCVNCNKKIGLHTYSGTLRCLTAISKTMGNKKK